MSGKIVGWAMEQHTGSPAAKLVLVKLADNAGEDGLCWPSIELIATHTELGLSTVYKHLTGLCALGLIKSVELIAQHGGVMKGFQLSLPATAAHIPPRRKTAESIPPGRKEILPGGKTIPPGRKEILPGGMHIEEPSVEPPIEPSVEPSLPGVPSQASSDIDLAVEAFNEGANQCPRWAAARGMTAQRHKMIAARLKEVGLAGWREAVMIAARSSFLGGPIPTTGDHRNWRLTIQWFAKAENFTKIVEGAYPAGTRSTTGLDSVAAGMQDFFDRQTA